MNYQILSPRKGRLMSSETFKHTPIRGYGVAITGDPKNKCHLSPNGNLVVSKGFEWDFASGAVDTPDMVKASLAHDALCVLIDKGKLPAKEQKNADRYFRQVLKESGTSWFRRWYSYAAVRIYQYFNRKFK